MTLNGFASYVPTADEFNSHWEDVDADRATNMLAALVLQGNFARTDFITQRDALDQAIIAVEGLENARELATGDRDTMKEALRDRIGQFRAAVELHLKKTSYHGAMPTVPQMSIAESKFLRPFDDMADLWSRINTDTGIEGFTGPLLLRAGYDLATFQGELQSLRSQFKAVTEAENDITIARRRRDSLLAPLRERMLQYRRAIELEYGEGHPFWESLPDLYASSGGSTPTLPTVRYDWVETGASMYDVWVEMIAGLIDAQTLYLRVGAQEFFTAFSPAPGEVFKTAWSGVVIDGEIDEVKIRNGQNEDIAEGVRDQTLPDPG